MSWRARLLLVVLVALAFSRAPQAQSPSAIKLATIVPDGSVWDKSLKQMGVDWKAATGDRVSLTVYSGGSQGDESTVLRKMRLNALQGASLTVVGLSSIDWSFNVFNIPFFFQSYDELNDVIDKLTPVLKQRVEAKGFVLVVGLKEEGDVEDVEGPIDARESDHGERRTLQRIEAHLAKDGRLVALGAAAVDRE